jgi:hypothetical protein
MKYAKAIVGFLVAGLGSVATAMADEVVTGQEWVTAILVAVGALGFVWGVPNRTEDVH